MIRLEMQAADVDARRMALVFIVTFCLIPLLLLAIDTLRVGKR